MDLQEVGAALAAARKSGNECEIDFSQIPFSDAERGQDYAVVAYGGERIGWKIGATNDAAQKMLGLKEPFLGPMVADGVLENGAEIPWNSQYRGIECEYAFRFAADYPLQGQDLDRDSLIAAIESCHPALEIIGRRTPGEGPTPMPGLVIDFGGHGGFVEGPPIPNWQEVDLHDTQVAGRLDGEQTNQGSGAAVLGHPLNSLLWFAGKMRDRGLVIKAGEIVTTGTVLGIIPVKAGSEIVGDYGELGQVSIRFQDKI